MLTVEPLLGYNLTCLINLVLISVITVGLSELSVRYVEPLSGKLTALLDKQSALLQILLRKMGEKERGVAFSDE